MNNNSENNNTIEEYKDLSTNMRHYANMRFAQLTLFVSFSAVLIYLIFSNNFALETQHKIIIKFGGMIFSIAFWIMEERSADYWHKFCQRATQLEELLNFRQYHNRPARKFVSATNATRLIYFFCIIFWISQISN